MTSMRLIRALRVKPSLICIFMKLARPSGAQRSVGVLLIRRALSRRHIARLWCELGPALKFSSASS